MNLWNVKQKDVVGVVSGLGRIHKFHFNTIPNSWLKVNVKEVMSSNAALMYSYEATDQNLMKDIVGSNALCDEKFIKA
jgi:hypothetical protein